MYGAHQHIDLVALHQLVGVFDAFGRVRLIIDFEKLDLAATQLAALLVERHAKTVFNCHAQLGKGAGVGQHQPDPYFARLRMRKLWQKQASGRSANQGSTLRQNKTA